MRKLFDRNCSGGLRQALPMLALVLALGSASFAFAAAAPAPELSLNATDGHEYSLAEYRGKVLVVNFWATWCVPCRHELPLFRDIEKRYGDRAQVIAISLDDASTRAHIQPFVNKRKLSFPILLGSVADLQKLGMGKSIPATAFLDANGNIVERILGEVSKSDLRHALDWIVNRKGSPPPALVNKFTAKKHSDNAPIPVMH